jgi:hypothetical protein
VVIASCGHHVCNDCVSTLVEKKPKCNICGRKYEITVDNNNNSFLKDFEHCFEKITLSLEHEFERSILLVKGMNFEFTKFLILFYLSLFFII